MRVNCNRLSGTAYWGCSTVNSILKKEIYAGNLVQGKFHQIMRSKSKPMPREDRIIVEDTHEPIIDKETWEKAQLLLNMRTREIDLNANLDIFAGFVECGDCGRAMAKAGYRHADGVKTYTLNCRTYRRTGNRYCSPHRISLEVLSKIILDDLKAIIACMDNLKELAALNTSDRSKSNRAAERSKMKAEMERIQEIKRSIYEDYKEALISEEEYISYRQEYQKKEDPCSRQIETLEKKGDENEDVFEIPWLKCLLELRDIEALDRDIIVEMISEITVYENRRIRIVYNFSNDLEAVSLRFRK